MNNKKQILIVEDESIVAMDIRRTLQNLGYEITGTVASGQAAVQEARQNPPDLVLMDIALNGPMDGIEAAAQIRSDLGVPIVYLTAHTEDMTVDRAITVEPFGYLGKPFKDRELKAAVETALTLSKSQKELKASKAGFHNIVEKSDAGIVVVDENKTIKFLNPMAKIMFGFKSKHIIGEKLDFPVIVGEVTNVEITRSGSKRGVGEMHTVETKWEGEPAYMVSVRDITDRKEIEDKAREHMRDLELFHEAVVGRELKMIELKEHIAELEAQLAKK
ncbi:MAG: response regulator [Phycisphaerae bacterium]|nr:response regulator [Phycisphaerae bacterium]